MGGLKGRDLIRDASWAGSYIGRPFHDPSWTCWALVRRVLAEQFKLDVPAFDGISAADPEAIDYWVHRESPTWRLIVDAESYFGAGWRSCRAGDVAVFRMGRWLRHIGILTCPLRVLHVTNGTVSYTSRLAEYEHVKALWGVYRHPEACLDG